jgi:hypothetical protein
MATCQSLYQRSDMNILFQILFEHRYLNFLRSATPFHKFKKGLNVLFVLTVLLIGFSFGMIVGSLVERGLRYKVISVIQVIPLSIAYLFCDLSLRLFLQKSNVEVVRPYQLLGVSRRHLAEITIADYFLSATTLSSFAIYAGVYFVVYVSVSLDIIFMLILVFIAITVFNSAVLSILKNSEGGMVRHFLISFILPATLLLLVFYFWRNFVSYFSGSSYSSFYVLLIIISLLIASSFVAVNYLRIKLFSPFASRNYDGFGVGLIANDSGVSAFSQVQVFLAIELRLLFRVENVRKILIASVLTFIPLLMLRLRGKVVYEPFDIFYPALFTGFFPLGYGQYFYTWESSFYSCYLSRDYSRFAYLLAKFIIMSLYVCLTTVVGLVIFWNHTDFQFSVFATGLYNLGFLLFLVMFAGLYNRGKINLDAKGLFANWQQLDSSKAIIAIPYILIPFVVITVTDLVGLQLDIEFVLIGIGSLFFVSSKFWMNGIGKLLFKKRRGFYKAFINHV